MDVLMLAFVFGTVLSALAGNAAEWRAGAPARLIEPFVSPESISRSLMLVTVAGPYLLVGEALVLIRQHRQPGLLVSLTILFAAAWALAYGILCLEFFWQLAQML